MESCHKFHGHAQLWCVVRCSFRALPGLSELFLESPTIALSSLLHFHNNREKSHLLSTSDTSSALLWFLSLLEPLHFTQILLKFLEPQFKLPSWQKISFITVLPEARIPSVPGTASYFVMKRGVGRLSRKGNFMGYYRR
jgi:hypothetical protein